MAAGRIAPLITDTPLEKVREYMVPANVQNR
jgi:hypothetical protein